MKTALCCLLPALLALPAFPQETTFRSSVNVVVIDVRVAGRDGKPIEDLTKQDFQVYEDGKLQQLQSVDLQRLDSKPLAPVEATLLPARDLPHRSNASATPPPATPNDPRFQNRRLIVMLFDFSSMEPAEQIRTVTAAEKFISTQLTGSDLVSILLFANQLRTVQDFTDDRDLLLSTIKGFHVGEGSELAGMADTGADAEDASGQFVADETEFNIFNTDRKLMALEDAARKLAEYPEKKALVYFSSGVEKTGVDNQSQLRATINAAVRSNVSFYPIDARGLVAMAPGGDATQAGAAGSGLFSGRGQRAVRDSFQNQQETLVSLAQDTGGKASLDSNDLTVGMRQIQKDIDSYYVISYASSNTAEDGRYRRVQVKLAPRVASLHAKLDYRQGYFAPASFNRMTGADKEAQLQKALDSGNPVTDLPLAVEIDYFRLSKGKYFVPVSVKIPGSALTFRNKGSRAATELDFATECLDARGRPAASVRDTIPLKVDQNLAGQVVRKQVQYDTGFTLTPGKYTLKFVARENGEGKVGSFESPFYVPDLGSGSALRLSSIILSNQREPVKAQIAAAEKNKKLIAENPLVDAVGEKTVPNVTRVFRPGQNLMVYFNVYDPALPDTQTGSARSPSVMASVALYRGDRKVAESSPVRANRLSDRWENALPVRLQLPLKDTQPGQYACQVNIIDQLGKKFAFPRTPLVILAATPPQLGTH